MREFVSASKIIKANFRKVLLKYREFKKGKNEMDEMFRLVNEFDKGEGYDNWL